MRTKSILTLVATSLFVASCQTASADQPERMQVVRLEHAQANSMAQTLQQFASGTELTVAAAPGQNALLLRGSHEQVSQALELIVRLDLPKREEQVGSNRPEPNKLGNVTVIYCRNGNAKELAEAIKKLLPRDMQHNGNQHLTIVAHEEANALMLGGPSKRVDQVRKLIATLDRNGS